MFDRMVALAAAAVLATVGVASHAADNAYGGYLTPGELDATSVIEPAPRPGDPRYEADRKIFRATRRLVGSPRWELATNDADMSVPAMLRNFSCAVGVELTPANAPMLVAVVRRAGFDTSYQTRIAKEAHKRQRPFTIDKGPVCQPQSELYEKKAQRMSYDYPSGHTGWGWTWTLVLSSIAPDRAQQILERGRVYGDSRFVCGAHNESAVEAGMLLASATMVLVATKSEYQTDLAAAREEFDALRGGAPPAQNCEAESALLSQRVMPKLETKSRR
ncbi:acid phosphatase [Steroidobacter agaridevorans]|uniref:acid phosphatase n=1 Tax=Steroidobacter agaridevorans TaxID=2695856 RepID=UPI00132B3E64|nr:phosphatase PAP2 family protein [Steroidobacter agaridevorans]GFE89801.1 acid phosphatase [Steroidobacter agaridevorans]